MWNRTGQLKDPMTGKNKKFIKPKKEWIILDKPELRIIEDDLWKKTQARLKEDRKRSYPSKIEEDFKNESKVTTETSPILSSIWKYHYVGVVKGPIQFSEWERVLDIMDVMNASEKDLVKIRPLLIEKD